MQRVAIGPQPKTPTEQPAAGRLQRIAVDETSLRQIPPIVHDVMRSPGQPLDAATRSFMEPRFGHDFSHVRVHTDVQAANSARAVNALAYTVGRDIVFSARQHAPTTDAGRRLMAHELAHVVQQAGRPMSLRPFAVAPDGHPAEREAEAAADAVANDRPVDIGRVAAQPTGGMMLHRHKDDLVAYTGGQSAAVYVISAGKVIYTGSAVSGHPGHGTNEPGEGPIPDGSYIIHPRITRPAVTKLEGGVCGANGIASGYQEITSTDPSPCSGSPAHYCNIPCPTTSEPTLKCFTPRDCWGPKRIKIEGNKAVVTPTGERKVRDGFYLHGGNPADAVSSGCVKSLNDDAFTHIRTLTGVKGAVPFCVGKACEPKLSRAIGATVAEAVESVADTVSSVVGSLFGQ